MLPVFEESCIYDKNFVLGTNQMNVNVKVLKLFRFAKSSESGISLKVSWVNSGLI